MDHSRQILEDSVDTLMESSTVDIRDQDISISRLLGQQ